MKRKWLYLFFIILFSILVLATLVKPLGQDEGVFLTIARGLLDGKLPYRDFFDHKPPGIYFFFALVFKIFGPSLLAAKVALIVVNLGTVIFTFLIAKKLEKSGWWAAILLVFGLIFFEGNYIVAEPFVAFCLAIIVYLYLNVIDKSRDSIGYFWIGILLGLAVIFKQTAVINIGILILMMAFRKKIWPMTFTILGFVVLILPFFIFILTNGLGHEALRQIVTLNINYYPNEPFLKVLTLLLPVFTFTIPLWIGFVSESKATWRTESDRLILLFAVVPMLVFWGRHYPHYWIQVLPFVAIIGSFAFQKYYVQSLSIIFIILVLIIPVRNFSWRRLLLSEQLESAEYIQKVPPSRILVENQFSPYYFLSNKDPLNKYLYITEINDWSEESGEKTLVDLKSSPETLVLWTNDQNYAYAKKLQSYILENYHTVKCYDRLGLAILKHN